MFHDTSPKSLLISSFDNLRILSQQKLYDIFSRCNHSFICIQDTTQNCIRLMIVSLELLLPFQDQEFLERQLSVWPTSLI